MSTSSKKDQADLNMGWERLERERRWWKTDYVKELCLTELCMEACVRACVCRIFMCVQDLYVKKVVCVCERLCVTEMWVKEFCVKELGANGCCVCVKECCVTILWPCCVCKSCVWQSCSCERLVCVCVKELRARDNVVCVLVKSCVCGGGVTMLCVKGLRVCERLGVTKLCVCVRDSVVREGVACENVAGDKMCPRFVVQ